MNTRPSSRYSWQSGHVAIIGIVLMTLLVVGGIGFLVFTMSQKEAPIIRYTPPAVTADDPIAQGSSTKEIFQDVKILDAAVKRGDEYQKATATVLNDKELSISTNETATTVEQDRLSDLQTDFIAECDRRIKNLTDAQPSFDKLTAAQRPVVESLVNSEITALNGMKARVSAATSLDAFAADRQALNQEYNSYLLALAQLNLLVWADDQAVLETKFNRVGGKFQERINDASSKGTPTSVAQSALNGFQANKVTATDLTAVIVKVVPTIKPGEHNSNRSVLKTYHDQLNTAHNELVKALASAKRIATEIQTYDSAQ